MAKAKSSKNFSHLVRDSTILHFVCEIRRFGILDSGFCGIVESLVDLSLKGKEDSTFGISQK